MIGLRTLVLQPDYTPRTIFPNIGTMPAEAALVSVMTGDLDCVKFYDRKVLTPSRSDLQWPSVVVEKKMYRRLEDARLTNTTLFYRDHGLCQYCEKPLTIGSMTRDHVMPRSKGGPDEWKNVVAACKNCNAQKDNKLPQGIWIPKRRPYQPSMLELFDRRKDFPIKVGEMEWTDFMGEWRAPVSLMNRIECEAV